MLKRLGIFSPGYTEYLARKDMIKGLVRDAQERAKSATLYGETIDVNNPEELVALYYIMYRDYDLFHERI
jgi:hypothetical protein